MDSLLQIIKNLKKEEVRNFKIHSNKYQRNGEMKVVKLFDHLRSDKYTENEEALLEKLFSDNSGNMNAYYRLKNRLKTDLEKSLLNLHHNLDEKITTVNLITLSSIFSYKSQYDLALYYLKKAEKMASDNEFYDLLDLIYNEIILLSHNYNEINPIEYIERRKENQHKKELITQANHDLAAIRYKLIKTNFNKIAEDIPATLQRILQELNVKDEVAQQPKIKMNIHFCIRNILLQNKDFKSLEIYMKETLGEFDRSNIFTKSTHKQKITVITWIINSLFVNKKWEEAIEYIELLHDELHKYNKLHYDGSIWTYYQSLITTYMSSGKVDEAIELLEYIKDLPAHKGVTFYDYVIYANLALCYYFKENSSEAIKTLSHLLNKEIYPKLAIELQFSLSILEVILHYDNSNIDYVAYRINEIKRQFRNILNREDYQEDREFIKIVNHLVNKPDPWRNTTVIKQAKNFIEKASSLQVGSGKIIDYGIWVNCKMNKRKYYPELLKSLNTVTEEKVSV